MDKRYIRLKKCLESIRARVDFAPKVALVLGSGLGGYAEKIDIRAAVNYSEIEGMPVSTAPGHVGRFVFGYVGKVPVVVMQGRVHYYEGYSMEDVVLPIRLMGLMGAEVLFLTNAAGGLHPDFNVGDFMVIDDHIMNFVPSPLIGPNIEELGARFPDMSEIYKRELRDKIKKSAEALGIDIKHGVYIQLTGPNYESPAEIRMCQRIGADAVGMSTAAEAVAANHMGMKVCGISCITNMAAGISKHPLSQEEVEETGVRVASDFEKLVTESIKSFGL